MSLLLLFSGAPLPEDDAPTPDPAPSDDVRRSAPGGALGRSVRRRQPALIYQTAADPWDDEAQALALVL